jgi:hypothetical protein
MIAIYIEVWLTDDNDDSFGVEIKDNIWTNMVIYGMIQAVVMTNMYLAMEVMDQFLMILMMIFIIRLKIYKMYVINFYKNHSIIIIQY